MDFGPESVAANDILCVIEDPSPSRGPVIGRTLVVSGWILCPAGLDTVSLRCDGGDAVPVQTGIARPDVAAAFPDIQGSRRAGFTGLLDTAGLAPGRHRIRIEATGRGIPLQGWDREFEVGAPARAYATWRSRCDQRGHAPMEDSGLRRTARALTISVVVDVPDTSASAGLWQTLRSIEQQCHPACDTIVRWGAGESNAPLPGTVPSLGDALQACRGSFVTIVTAGEALLPGALELAALNLAAHPGLGFLYADHDMQLPAGGASPVFKPGWSPLLLEQHDYIGHPWFARKCVLVEALTATGAFDIRACGQLVLAIAARSPSIAHLPRILLSQPPAASANLPPEPAFVAAETAQTASISIVIPTRLSRPDVLARCLGGLARTRLVYPAMEVMVVLNGISDPGAAVEFLSAWDVLPLQFDGAFNWSAINNAAAAVSQGDLLLFMNDDVEPQDDAWLGAMARLALRPEVGAVGAVLRYPDGRIQHAGVMLSASDRIECRHAFRFCRGDEPELKELLPHDRDQTAVTGACLLTRRALFDSVGGFDEELGLVFNDVDYCLRLAERGLRSVVAARAGLVHHEGLSRGGLDEATDERFFKARWLGALPPVDPFYNPALRRDSDDWTLDPLSVPPTAARLAPGGRVIESRMNTDLAWKQWGRSDPYFGVITDEKYRSRNLTDEAKEAFFTSGRSHVQHVLRMCRAHLARDFKPVRMLDFGCGVGRLVVPFAELVEHVVGIDVAEGMLAEARRNCDARGLKNVSLVMSDDELSALTGSFDLIHSAIVFQHIEVPRGRDLFRRLLQRLSPQGVGVLHVTYAKQSQADNWGQPPLAPESAPEGPRPRGLRQLLPSTNPTGRSVTATKERATPSDGSDPEMQMNTYNLNELLFMVQQLGVRKFYVEFTDHGGELGSILYFQRP